MLSGLCIHQLAVGLVVGASGQVRQACAAEERDLHAPTARAALQDANRRRRGYRWADGRAGAPRRKQELRSASSTYEATGHCRARYRKPHTSNLPHPAIKGRKRNRRRSTKPLAPRSLLPSATTVRLATTADGAFHVKQGSPRSGRRAEAAACPRSDLGQRQAKPSSLRVAPGEAIKHAPPREASAYPPEACPVDQRNLDLGRGRGRGRGRGDAGRPAVRADHELS